MEPRQSLEGRLDRMWIQRLADRILLMTVLRDLFNEIQELRNTMADLVTSIKTLQDDVTNLTTVDTSAVALISGLATQLAAALQTASNAGATPEQLQALADLHAAITKGSADLAAAVSANTPK